MALGVGFQVYGLRRMASATQTLVPVLFVGAKAATHESLAAFSQEHKTQVVCLKYSCFGSPYLSTEEQALASSHGCKKRVS